MAGWGVVSTDLLILSAHLWWQNTYSALVGFAVEPFVAGLDRRGQRHARWMSSMAGRTSVVMML